MGCRTPTSARAATAAYGTAEARLKDKNPLDWLTGPSGRSVARLLGTEPIPDGRRRTPTSSRLGTCWTNRFEFWPRRENLSRGSGLWASSRSFRCPCWARTGAVRRIPPSGRTDSPSGRGRIPLALPRASRATPSAMFSGARGQAFGLSRTRFGRPDRPRSRVREVLLVPRSGHY